MSKGTLFDIGMDVIKKMFQQEECIMMRKETGSKTMDLERVVRICLKKL